MFSLFCVFGTMFVLEQKRKNMKELETNENSVSPIIVVYKGENGNKLTSDWSRSFTKEE